MRPKEDLQICLSTARCFGGTDGLADTGGLVSISLPDQLTPVICFLLGNSPASEFYMPTFRNTVFHLHRQVGIIHTYLPMKMEQTECSETSAYKIQTMGNYPEESIQHSENGELLKSRIQLPPSHKHYRISSSN